MPIKKEFGVLECGFSFECPRKWEDLERTPFANIRNCTNCEKPVFRCDTQAQADWAIANKQCAAVVIEMMVQAMGDIIPPRVKRRKQNESTD